ncbi:MAG: outer membrane beta-barrel protein [Bacteroidota bacterium]|nr:outer membrane beta-barrel protein [Bacteroidota bacterium]
MKKTTLLLSLLLGISLSAFAQLDIRAFGGVNFLQLTSDQGTSLIDGTLHNRTVSGRPGYQFGGAVTFGERFFVQPGIQWVTVATKLVNKNTVNGNELTDEATISAISVPLKLGLRLIDPSTEDIFNVRIFGGIDGFHVTSVNQNKSSGEVTISKEDFSNIIMNADFGMGIDILFLYVDAGYLLGLNPVYATGDSGKANAFYLNAGVRIKL